MVEQEIPVETDVTGEHCTPKTLFVHTPPRRRRWPALAGSVALHGMVLAIMLTWRVDVGNGTAPSAQRKYPVRFLQLQMPRAYQKRTPPGSGEAGMAGSRAIAGLRMPNGKRKEYAAVSNREETAADAARALVEEHRRFRLPSSARVKAVKQTLVQLDVPPDVVVKHEIPLPAVMLWTQTEPPPMKKRFIAPPLKALPKTAQKLPLAAALEPPNREINIAPVQMAASVLNKAPAYVPPPAVASPATAGQEPAKELPKLGLEDSYQPSAANIISLPDNPLRSTTMIALPPANQVASSGAVKAESAPGQGGSEGNTEKLGGRGHGEGEPGDGGSVTQSGGAAGGKSGALAGGGVNTGVSPNTGSGNTTGGGGSGTATASAGTSGTGSASAGTGAGKSTGEGGNGAGEGPESALAGFTRLTLPKDGKFGVVVQGYAGAVPYPESVGALSGKVVYTVYLKVGLKRSWILQYCLPKASGTTVPRGKSATPLEAPWPYLVMRPDGWGASDPDYVMVHGTLTSAGKFDQMTLAFPDELERKDLLLKSLKMWAFRPASRDGEPIAVEVLLIIPRQPD